MKAFELNEGRPVEFWDGGTGCVLDVEDDNDNYVMIREIRPDIGAHAESIFLSVAIPARQCENHNPFDAEYDPQRPVRVRQEV